jgi:Xaa-Pro aminopeptidase
MNLMTTTDAMINGDDWSDLSRFHPMPEIDHTRLHAYRTQRLKQQLEKSGAAMCILFNPISMRYAINYRNYALFQTHIPTTYVFYPLDGPVVAYGAYEPEPQGFELRPGQMVTYFDGGTEIESASEALADDVVAYLNEIGTDNRRVAVEYVTPSVTQALEKRGLEVIDGVKISEHARVIKSEDEIACMRWAIAVAELGISKVKQALKPGVSELQLWALLNYTNLANNGDWHDGRMLASGPRINPWLQEASPRKIQSGDLVGFDTDMVGPNGYFADISRTFHCGPAKPTAQQKRLYSLAVEEITYNMNLVKPGIRLREFQKLAWPVPEEFQANAYTCVAHAVGMCDEYPQIKHGFRMENPYDCELEAGMVMCIESYIGAQGERDGVKLEQQVLVTPTGYQLLTNYPFEEELML